MADHKLDIFKALDELNRGNYSFYENLSDEERKGFAPLITMRWASGCNDPLQIILLNALVNPAVFTLGKHPGLLWKLLCVANTKQPRRYSWLKTNTGKSNKKAKTLAVIAAHTGCSTRVANQYLPLLDNDKILQMAEDLGYEKDEIAALKKEFE